jgi:HD-GYP domain-containing protein (c-di-GMP phosphodiesterase class II)
MLKPGMKIDQSICDQSGRVLITRGAALDEAMIELLFKLGIMSVYVGEGAPTQDECIPDGVEPVVSEHTQELIDNSIVEDPAKVKLTQDVKNRVQEGIQYLYSNTESDTFTQTTDSIADELMGAIMSSNAIAVDIDTLKVSDEYTFKHSVDVATMAMVIAKKHGLSAREVREIGIAGLLHDVGKSKIAPEVLNKPGKLTDEEFTTMKQHSLFGYAILKDKKDISEAVKIGVLQHHEKINGKGYPFAVESSKICPYARILAVADIYDALVTERPYKKAFSKRDAVEMLMSMTDALDVGALRSFLGSVILYPVNSNVKLSNGETARVVENNPACILRPKVIGLTTGRVYDLAWDLGCASIIIE